MDRSVDPCVDFYRYSCGSWNKTNPIPPDQARWNVYSKLAQENQQFLWGILEEAAQTVRRRARQRSRRSATTSAPAWTRPRVEKAGAAPLKHTMDAIAGIAALEGPAAACWRVCTWTSARAAPCFGFGSNQDFADAEQVIAFASAGGLGLPDRDYYTEDRRRSRKEIARQVPGARGADVRAARRSPAAAKARSASA